MTRHIANEQQNIHGDVKVQSESNTKNIDDLQLHWFWKLTTKRYFFPVFYFSLLALQTIVYFFNKEGISVLLHPIYIFGNMIIFMFFAPAGLLYLTFILQGKDYNLGVMQSITAVFLIIFWLLIPISISKIYIYKSRHNKVLKWFILTLIIVMLISFVGFFGGVNLQPEY